MSTSDTASDQVVFENIPDQYAKGEDVKVQFTTVNEISSEGNEDQIGILRVGSTNIQECLAYAPVEVQSAAHHGTATFPSSCLPTTDDEFYQFCYISKKRKCLGSSIPFQLNCSVVDIDLLSQALSEKTHVQTGSDALIAFDDHDNADVLVFHSKNMLVEEKLRQENRQLVQLNRRLDEQKNECRIKLENLEIKSNEYIAKVKKDMQNLTTTHKASIEELASRQRLEAKLRSEYDACRSLCSRYQAEALQFAERCRTVEESSAKLSQEAIRVRSQLTLAKELSEEQSLQIVDLEKRLAQSDAAVQTANDYQLQLEQQLRDLRVTSEKYQLSVQGQFDAYSKQASQQENQIHALESANSLLKEELHSTKTDNVFLVTMTNQDKQMTKDLQEELEQLHQLHQMESEEMKLEINALHEQLNEANATEGNYKQLKSSFTEIEKRCLKHQKSEIEVKKQLTSYKEFIGDLQQQIQDLTERLAAGSDEYKGLYRKYFILQRSLSKDNHPTTLSDETGLNEEALVTLLRNSYELQQEEEKENDTQTPLVTEEIRQCPMCYWEFPTQYSLEMKKDHIDGHFT